MSGVVTPGDVGCLSETALAAAGEYVALAALAFRPNSDAARLQLASSCGDPDAFTWWWALSKRDSSHLMYTSKQPDRVDVPDELLDEVCAHIVTPHLQQQRPSAESLSRAELLKRLDTREPRVLGAARRVVSAPDQHAAEVLNAALSVLGASADASDRVRVLEHAGTLHYSARPAAYLTLTEPVTDTEAKQITAGLAEIKSRGAEASTWQLAAAVLARLPLDDVADFIETPFRHGTGRAPLLQAGLVGKLGPGRLQSLLEQLDSPDIAEPLLHQAAATFAADDLISFAEWAHARYPSEVCSPLRAKIAKGLDRRWQPEEARQKAQEGLWRCAMAATDAAGVADELIATLSAEDVPVRATQVDTDSAARQLGAVTARFLAANSAEFAITSACSAMDALPLERKPAFFSGYMAVAVDPQSGLVPAMLDLALSAEDTATAALAAGTLPLLVQRASQTPEQAARVLIVGTDVLDAVQAAGLLGAASSTTPPPGRLQSAEPTLGPGVSWTNVSPATYLRVITAAAQWPTALFGAVDRAIASLDEPEARQPSPAVLTALLNTAERVTLRDQLGEATNGHVERLLRQSEPSVLDAACRWVRRLDVQGGPADIERAQMIMDADDRRAHRHAALSSLRQELAACHAEHAVDTSLDAEARVQHLRMAARLNPSTGRDVAFALTAARTVEVRRAAAEAIEKTPGSAEDHDRLVERLQEEDDAHVRGALETALHRLTSSSLDEAITNLLSMLELTSGTVDTQVLLPDASHHERFIQWSDRARARSTNPADPGTFIEAALNVAHQMVDLAVVGRFDATGGPLKADQVEAIRRHSRGRLDEGVLVTRQDLVQMFPWFSTVAALREKRGAHSSKLGSLEPVRYRSDDLISARDMLRTIAEGWVRDMQRSRDLRVARPA